MVFALAMNAAWTWRNGFPQLPLFVACLAFFHFMEFWITARYNTRRGKVEGMLSIGNGGRKGEEDEQHKVEKELGQGFESKVKWIGASATLRTGRIREFEYS
jgi:hypothetical protein